MTKPWAMLYELNARETYCSGVIFLFCSTVASFLKEYGAASKVHTRWVRETERNCLWEEKEKSQDDII